MVLTLVFLTLVICIGIELLRERRRAARPAKDRAAARHSETAVLERWFHGGHTWALVGEQSQAIEVGADDFAQWFVGPIDAIDLPERGSRVEQGQLLATLRRQGRRLELVSPVTGVLVDVNRRLANHPDNVNASPYGRGWIARIAPAQLKAELRSMLRGAGADRWREQVRAQFAEWFAPQLGPVLQDGGQWVADLGARLDDREWEELRRRLFPEPRN